MLRRFTALVSAIVCGFALLGFGQDSHADDDKCGARTNTDGLFNVESGVKACGSESSGPQPSDGSSQDSRFKSGDDHLFDSDYGDTAAADSCYDRNGKQVDCWYGEYAWNSAFDMYCKTPDAEFAELHAVTQHNEGDILYQCRLASGVWSHYADAARWAPPAEAAVDAESVAREVVATLELHPPTVGVGAFVYPDAQDWGLSWWVGAPMWLWVNSKDTLQWGTHTLSASLDGVTVTANVQANRVSYDTGDGAELTVCTNPGTSRTLDGGGLLRDPSTSGCDHRYMHTNTLGDKNSRYSVSATVTWRVTWSATNGQSDAFTLEVPSIESPAVHIGEVYVVDLTYKHVR